MYVYELQLLGFSRKCRFKVQWSKSIIFKWMIIRRTYELQNIIDENRRLIRNHYEIVGTMRSISRYIKYVSGQYNLKNIQLSNNCLEFPMRVHHL